MFRSPSFPDKAIHGRDHFVRSSRGNYVIETWSDIEPIRSRWKVIESSGVSTPFQSYAWVSALLQSVGRSFDAEPHIVIAKDRKTGEDLMLIPLVRRRAQLLQFLEFPDFKVSDYNSPIISRSIASDTAKVAEVWDAVIQSLPASDILYLQKIPQILSDVPNPLISLKGFRPECYSSWQLPLDENLNDLERKTLPFSARREIRRRTRRLQELGALRYVIPASQAERKALFDVLRQQRQSRFASLGRRNILTSPAHSRFYDLILQSEFDQEVVTVHGLKVGDQIIATAFGLYWQKRFHLLMITLASGEWPRLAPGLVMIWNLIAHMHAKGCRTFDFTIGDEPYKRRLGAKNCTLSEYFRARSPVGAPYALGLWLWPFLVATKRKFAKTGEGHSTTR